ncbi:MAG TPA: aminoglycoside phosphotransferase family protein, partial [Mobilitalea sp.]|nr:aminoglycoside phosphotransferase family protein [Mobilitalea sp.]
YNFAIKLFRELPKGDNICHGDFHPGNIMMQDGMEYIIDWTGACLGSGISDIAHTYLLMTHVPVVPGQSYVQHKILTIAGSFMARSYLKEVMKLMKVDMVEFSKWTVAMSLFRVYCGLPSELEERIRYIENCYNLNQKGTDAASWYKLL